jgi:hypothetical protein
LVDAAFDHFYNMDYDRAIQEFEKVLDRRPNDPSAGESPAGHDPDARALPHGRDEYRRILE